MVTFRQVRQKAQIDGFQTHHLIPKQILEMRCFSKFFGEIRCYGFEPNDFCGNGMYLPSTEELAMAFGLPQHCGPHPKYNEMVADHVARISVLPQCDALPAITKLQNDLRLALRLCSGGEIALIRDPMKIDIMGEAEMLRIAVDLRSRNARLP